MRTYTINFRDTTTGTDHTFAGMRETSVEWFVGGVITHPAMILVSVTMDEDS